MIISLQRVQSPVLQNNRSKLTKDYWTKTRSLRKGSKWWTRKCVRPIWQRSDSMSNSTRRSSRSKHFKTQCYVLMRSFSTLQISFSTSQMKSVFPIIHKTKLITRSLFRPYFKTSKTDSGHPRHNLTDSCNLAPQALETPSLSVTCQFICRQCRICKTWGTTTPTRTYFDEINKSLLNLQSY